MSYQVQRQLILLFPKIPIYFPNIPILFPLKRNQLTFCSQKPENARKKIEKKYFLTFSKREYYFKKSYIIFLFWEYNYPFSYDSNSLVIVFILFLMGI